VRLGIEVARNSLNPYCGRVQCLLNDVARLLLERVTACLALELGWDDPEVRGRLNELDLG
jgi:hypothetical protein